MNIILRIFHFRAVKHIDGFLRRVRISLPYKTMLHISHVKLVKVHWMVTVSVLNDKWLVFVNLILQSLAYSETAMLTLRALDWLHGQPDQNWWKLWVLQRVFVFIMIPRAKTTNSLVINELVLVIQPQYICFKVGGVFVVSVISFVLLWLKRVSSHDEWRVAYR